MWKKLLSFLGRKTTADAGSAAFNAVKAQVEKVLGLRLNTDSDRDEHGEEVLQVLQCLDAGIEAVRQRANGYPANPISADVWLTGAGYGNLACALTHHFKTAGWLKREENASALWAKATLTVCAHYHHMVGPAMLANADCHDRLGNVERSSQMYAAIVNDFAFLLNDWVNQTEAPANENRVALESLQTAVERLVARGTTVSGTHDLLSLQSLSKNILSRSTTT